MKRTIQVAVFVLLLPMALWSMACEPGIIGPAPNPTNPTQPGPTNPDPRPEPRPNPDPDPRVEPPPTRTTNPNTPTSFKDKWTQTPKTEPATGKIGATFGRSPRRLSVEHLRNSIPKLFPGLQWHYKSGNNYITYFDRYAQTLGEADYLQITQTTRESSPLFFKFMDDMAAFVCKFAIDADTAQKDLSKRHIIRYDGAGNVDKTLRFLRLKFHGIWVPEASKESITQLRQLYDKIMEATKKNEKEAWKGICIAVLTAPEFFAY